MSYDNDSYRIDCKYIPKKNEEINTLLHALILLIFIELKEKVF